MTLTVASFNIRKAIGTDRKRKPERILSVLGEIDADIVALQEADKRVGTRGAAVPHELIDEHGAWQVVDFDVEHRKLLDLVPRHRLPSPIKKRLDTRNLGWHGNAILVREGAEILHAEALDLPTLEPRGAVMAEVALSGGAVRIVGMHLDLSGLYRQRQIDAILESVTRRDSAIPTIIMGDTNEWRGDAPAMFGAGYFCADCGPSFHSRRPVASLDRIMVDERLSIVDSGVHRTRAAHKASDHLPVWARIKR